MPDSSSKFSFEIPTSLGDILIQWSRKASPTLSEDVNEKKYSEAFMALFGLYAKYHEELSDEDFARIFKFFRESGIAKRLGPEAPIAVRYAKVGLNL